MNSSTNNEQQTHSVTSNNTDVINNSPSHTSISNQDINYDKDFMSSKSKNMVLNTNEINESEIHQIKEIPPIIEIEYSEPEVILNVEKKIESEISNLQKNTVSIEVPNQSSENQIINDEQPNQPDVKMSEQINSVNEDISLDNAVPLKTTSIDEQSQSQNSVSSEPVEKVKTSKTNTIAIVIIIVALIILVVYVVKNFIIDSKSESDNNSNSNTQENTNTSNNSPNDNNSSNDNNTNSSNNSLENNNNQNNQETTNNTGKKDGVFLEDANMNGSTCLNGECTYYINGMDETTKYTISGINSDVFASLRIYSEYIKVNIYYEEKSNNKVIVGYEIFKKDDNQNISDVKTENELREKIGLFALGTHTKKLKLEKIGIVGAGFNNNKAYSYINYVFESDNNIKYEMKYIIPEGQNLYDLKVGNTYEVSFEVVKGTFSYEYNIKNIK